MIRIKSYMFIFMYFFYFQDMNLYVDISGRILFVIKIDKFDLYQVRYKNILKYMFFLEVEEFGIKLYLIQYLLI